MREHKRYDMIEGYLDGGMEPDARLEFERLLLEDSELAREFRSEQLIRNTLRNDSASIIPPSTEPSTTLIAELAATGVQTTAASSTISGVFKAIFGTGIGLSIVSTVGILGLIIGAILFAEQYNTPKSEPSNLALPTLENSVSSPIVPNGNTTPLNNVEDKTVQTTSKTEEKTPSMFSEPAIEPDEALQVQEKESESIEELATEEDQVQTIVKQLESYNPKDTPVIQDDSLRLQLKMDN